MAGEGDKNDGDFMQTQEVRLSGVELKLLGDNLEVEEDYKQKLQLLCTCQERSCNLSIYNDKGKLLDVPVTDSAHIYRAGSSVILLRLTHNTALITTSSANDASKLLTHLEMFVPSEKKQSDLSSVFNLRTEDSSAKQYFQFYGYLSQQQNMLQDYIRTGTYQSAMLQNVADFKDKVVLDVGAGTGALSFFALQAGARKVYAIEASNMSTHCIKLVKDNKLTEKMVVIKGKVEEVELPEDVDMIVSEPMGYMLFNERMLETYLHAKKWLKPGGKMFPTKAILYIAPFSDEALYLEQFSKANFWSQKCFHGMDLSSLRQEALEEYFRQPVLDTFDVRIVMAKPVGHMTDFLRTEEKDLLEINVPLQYKMWSTGMVHGLAFWFDVAFCGSESTVWLSTAPFQPLTHWYQIRVLLPKPIFIHKDQDMTGMLKLVANSRQSYDVTVDLNVPSLGIKSESCYDLKNPNFRYMTTPLSVPGTLHANPTDTYFQETSTTAPQTSNYAPQISNHAPQTLNAATNNIQTLTPDPPQLPLGSNISHSVTPGALQTVYSPVMSATSTTTPSLTPSLNPAAPHFVPLPDNRTSLPSAGGGYYQSTAMYMMGGQQVVYSQSPPGIGGSAGFKQQGGVVPPISTNHSYNSRNSYYNN